MFGKAPSSRSRMAGLVIAASAGAAAVSLSVIGTSAAQAAAPAMRVAAQTNASGQSPRQCGYAPGGTLVMRCTPPTFTEVYGSPNPVQVGAEFTVIALECDRVADVHATGRMRFVDVTTGKKLGTVTLSPSHKFVNCGRARVIDDEKLHAGKYKIRATYLPGGAIPIRSSKPATYRETVKRRS
jgi:hypothetical protein